MTSKTLLSNVTGFTPVIDNILEDLGITTAVIFGRIWRYCQMESGVCYASIDTIAKELYISYNTVSDAVDRLCSRGYLVDTTPDLKNRPHIYKDTGKANMRINISFGVESHTSETEEHTSETEEHTSETEDKDSIKDRSKDINIPAEEKSHHYTADEYKEMTKESLLKGMARQKGAQEVRVNQYPEDVRPIISAVCELFNLECPAIKSTHAGHWIQESRELKDACGEFEKQVLREIAKDFEQHKRVRGGTVPFPVSGPRSLVNTARAKAGELRSKQPVAQETYNGYVIPKGASRVYIDGKVFVPGLGEIEA